MSHELGVDEWTTDNGQIDYIWIDR